eukprot:TRINITY_DN4825_c0_g1_i4.p1 TRINITY_DN4825_c0_g1~~TRINITY_DN4825_c0_g1_i4.p1  ORF type:complete len:147 (-),score=18.92 TRINITY_DN4825_c0_g1_i4:9-410(-)
MAPMPAPVSAPAPVTYAASPPMAYSVPQVAQPMPIYSQPMAAPAPMTMAAPMTYAASAPTMYAAPAPTTAWTTQAGAGSCRNCGNVYMADSLFCRKCGTKRVDGPMDMFSQLDVNGDGQLSPQEFAAFMGRAY